MHVILLTGPKQSGKSTFAKALAEQIPDAVHEEFKKPLITMLYAMVGENFPEFVNLPYETLKTTQLGGMTGREWMIQLGNAMREKDPWTLPRLVFKRIALLQKQPRVVIVDDLGFEPEYSGALHVPGSVLLVVYFESRGDRFYKHGEQFDGDSRICLRGHADFIDPSVEDVLARIPGE